MKKYEKPTFTIVDLDADIFVCASHCGMILI